MKKRLFKIIICLTLFQLYSCKNEKKLEDVIVGYWEVDSIEVNNSIKMKNPQNSGFEIIGFNFYKNGTCESLNGSIKNWKQINENEIIIEDSSNDKVYCELINENNLKFQLSFSENNKQMKVIAFMSKKSKSQNNRKSNFSNEEQLENGFTNEIENKNAKVSGSASYPSDGIPDFISVYAKNIKTNEIFKHKFFDREQGYFEMELQNGVYIIFSTNDSSNIKPDLSQKIVVKNGKEIKNVIAQDLSVSGLLIPEEEEY